RIARQANGAFDKALAVLGRIEHDDIPALRTAPFGKMPRRERNLEIVGELVHEHAVTLQNGGFHGASGNSVPISKGRTRGKDNQGRDTERANIFAPDFMGARAEILDVHEN